MISALTAARRLEGLHPYRFPATPGAPAHRLHANEGVSPLEPATLEKAWADLRAERYPTVGELEAQIASVHQVASARVVVTAGLDDALCRLAWSMLEPGRAAVVTDPVFEMIPRYIQLAGGEQRSIPWLDTPFPTESFVAALEAPDVVMGCICSPSSPAGETLTTAAFHTVADAASAYGRLLVADLAYTEFADEDPTEALIARQDVCVARTFSKALGLAGLRLGYVVAPEKVADWMRTVGPPFAVSSASLAIAGAILPELPRIAGEAADRVRTERVQIDAALRAMGAMPIRSEGNFVLGRFGARAPLVVSRLAERGYQVRRIPAVDGAIRFTCPQDPTVLAGLLAELRSIAKEWG